MKLFPTPSLIVGLATLAAAPGFSPLLSAQIEFPAASPHAHVTQTVGATVIEVDYSRPSMKGRIIFGGLVPHGEVWRTGANASTKITFEKDVLLEGNEVPAGTYALYTIPEEDEWTIILSENTELWGAFDYDPEDDFLRFTVEPIIVQNRVDSFTIGFDALTEDGAKLLLEWAEVRVPIMIKTTDAERIKAALKTDMPAIDEADTRLLYNAANYYRKHDGDLEQAQEWIDAAVKRQADAYWMQMEKARIEAARGRDEAAVESARTALEKARSAGADSGMIAAIEAFIERHS